MCPDLISNGDTLSCNPMFQLEVNDTNFALMADFYFCKQSANVPGTLLIVRYSWSPATSPLAFVLRV